MTHPFSQKLDSLLTYCFAALFFFVPLLFLPFTNELFEFNKMQLTYTLTVIIVSLWLTQAILNRRLTISKNFLLIPLSLFILSQSLSTIFSINPHTSLWGYYSRFHGGLLSTLSYSALFVVFTSHFADKKDKLTSIILNSLLSGAGLISLYGVLEHLGIDAHLWVQDVKSRVFSTLGQPNWLSAYLVALLPLPIYLSLGTKNTRHKAIYAALSLLFFTTILFTKSRSGIGATFIVLFLIFLQQLLKSKFRLSKNFLAVFISLLLLLLAIGTPWTPNPSQIIQRSDLGGPLWPEAEPYLNKLNLSTQSKPLEVSRLSPIDQQAIAARSQGERFGGSDSFEIRRYVWEGAIQLFQRYPFLGTGVETFGYTYYWVKPKGHNLLSEWDFLYNKAHNEYLNFLANSGAVGLTTYLFLVLCIIFTFLSKLRKPQPLIHWALLFGFISILITNYFGFSVVPIAIFFFLFPAISLSLSPTSRFFTFGNGLILSKKQLKNNLTNPLGFSQYLQLIITLIPTLFALLIIYKHWQADYFYTKGKSYSDIGYIGNALPYLQKAVQNSPNEPIFRAELAESYADATLALTEQLASPEASDEATKKQLLTARDDFENRALGNVDQALTQNPWHLNFYKSKIKIDLSIATYKPEFTQQAITTILKATQLAPTDAKLLFTLGSVYQQAKDYQNAQAAYSAAIALKPDYQEAVSALNSLPQ